MPTTGHEKNDSAHFLVDNQRELLVKARKNARSKLKQLQRTASKQELEVKEAGIWKSLQHIGESILAVKDSIPKGEVAWIIKNVYSDEDEIIKLNPKCSAVKNAGLYFKRAKKGKRGYDTANMHYKSTITMIENETNLISHCTEALINGSLEEIDNVCKGLKKEVSNQLSGKKKVKEGNGNIPFRHYVIDGWDVYIGKNNTQNDELSIHFAKPNDLWFHVVAHAGSHCIIRRNKGMQIPPKDVVKKVAALSVWFSKAKHTTFSEVHVTERRFVRKRRKAPAGEVIAERCKIVRVAPISPQELFRKEIVKSN